jgi:chromatin remodeling complex protein RSC6
VPVSAAAKRAQSGAGNGPGGARRAAAVTAKPGVTAKSCLHFAVFVTNQGFHREGIKMADAKPKRANNALSKPVQPSADLAAIVGSAPIARSDVVSKVWEHIKKNNLQNPENKREILADDKLKKVFGGKDKVSMFEMNKHLSNHLK